MTRFVQVVILKYRLPCILVLGLILNSLSYFLALGLRFDFVWEQMQPVHRLALPMALLVFFRTCTYTYWNLNSGYWRYASTHDLLNIIKAHASSTLLLASAILLIRPPDFPRSVFFIELALSILFSGGSRLMVRIFCEYAFSRSNNGETSDWRDVVVIGAGESGHLLIKTMLSHKRLSYRPVAVLDDSELWQGHSIFGIAVFGPISSLEETLNRYPKVAAVIVAIPSLSNSRLTQIEKICASYPIPCKKVQSFEDIACIDADFKQDSLTIESVLEKSLHVQHEDEVKEVLSGRTVLVTGAGGSIGSELVRQVVAFGPRKIILLDNCEYNLFKIDREISRCNSSCKSIVASITDRARLYQIFATEKPEFVFHAAAYKHVPLMEANSYEAFKNNIAGTRNLLDASVQFSISRFVLISSDKAVSPSSVMGCSKLIAEMLVQNYASAQTFTGKSHPLGTAIVRFGNVINSTGSVIPIFKEQILSGGPVTITHPDMERYFMSIREAVRLVLTAGTLGQRGEIFLLDMGRPIKVLDVARKMMALYGRRDIQVVFTGIRPGEKMSEELHTSEEYRGSTRFDKVYRVQNLEKSAVDLLVWVSEMEAKLKSFDNQEIREAMFALVQSKQQATTGEKIGLKN